MTLTFDLIPWKSIGFQIFLRNKYVPSLVKIHWKMLILECSQGCYRLKIRPWPWPWKSIGFQTLPRTKYVPRLVKIHWRMLILECSQGCYGRTDGSVTISHRNFVGEGIKRGLCVQRYNCKLHKKECEDVDCTYSKNMPFTREWVFNDAGLGGRNKNLNNKSVYWWYFYIRVCIMKYRL